MSEGSNCYPHRERFEIRTIGDAVCSISDNVVEFLYDVFVIMSVF